MTIKEVEQQLGLPRATIRYYEKEQLVTPQRSGNTYREYSEDDIATLKKIIILRKLGFSVSEIRDFLEENVPLQELLEENIRQLEEKMKELNGAIKICKRMQSRQEDFDSFNESYYWEEIRRQERAGNKFIEILNDSLAYEKKLVFEYFGLVDENGKLYYDTKGIIRKVIETFLVFGVIYFVLDGIQGDWSIESFYRGIIQPFLVIGVLSLFGLPWHLFKKKCPELAQKYGVVGYGVVVTVITITVFIMLGLIVF